MLVTNPESVLDTRLTVSWLDSESQYMKSPQVLPGNTPRCPAVSVTCSSRRGPVEVPVPLQTSFLCLGLVGGSGVAPCTDRPCLWRPLLAQVGPFLPLTLWVLLTSMSLPGSGWDSPERACEGGRSSLETGTESDREGGGSGKEKVIVGALRAPGRDGRMCRSLGEKRG